MQCSGRMGFGRSLAPAQQNAPPALRRSRPCQQASSQRVKSRNIASRPHGRSSFCQITCHLPQHPPRALRQRLAARPRAPDLLLHPVWPPVAAFRGISGWVMMHYSAPRFAAMPGRARVTPSSLRRRATELAPFRHCPVSVSMIFGHVNLAMIRIAAVIIGDHLRRRIAKALPRGPI